MRKAAYDFAVHLMLARGRFEEMRDAFELTPRCNFSRPANSGLPSRARWRAAIDAELLARDRLPPGEVALYVAVAGRDNNSGS